MSNYFTRKKKTNQSEGPGKEALDIKWGRIFTGFTLALVLVAIIVYGVFQGKFFYDRIKANWDEIQFAYEKPQLVKAMRVQYENRQTRLEEEFTRQEKTSQEKLIDEVVGKLQGEAAPSEEPVKEVSKK